MRINLIDSDRFRLSSLALTMVRLRKHASHLEECRSYNNAELAEVEARLVAIRSRLADALDTVVFGADAKESARAVDELSALSAQQREVEPLVADLRLRKSSIEAEITLNNREIDAVARDIDQLVQG